MGSTQQVAATVSSFSSCRILQPAVKAYLGSTFSMGVKEWGGWAGLGRQDGQHGELKQPSLWRLLYLTLGEGLD